MHMSLTADPCAPTDVSKEIIDTLPLDLDILAIDIEWVQLFKELREEYGFVS